MHLDMMTNCQQWNDKSDWIDMSGRSHTLSSKPWTRGGFQLHSTVTCYLCLRLSLFDLHVWCWKHLTQGQLYIFQLFQFQSKASRDAKSSIYCKYISAISSKMVLIFCAIYGTIRTLISHHKTIIVLNLSLNSI